MHSSVSLPARCELLSVARAGGDAEPCTPRRVRRRRTVGPNAWRGNHASGACTGAVGREPAPASWRSGLLLLLVPLPVLLLVLVLLLVVGLRLRATRDLDFGALL